MEKSIDLNYEFKNTSFDALLNMLGYSEVIVLETPIFKYPHTVNTESSGTEITINILGGHPPYKVDRIGFAWNEDNCAFDVVQANIKKKSFETLKSTQVNSAKFLGYGFVDEKYFKKLNINCTKKLRETPGEFEHIHNTTTYEFLEHFGFLSDTYHNALIIETKQNSGGKRAGKNNKSTIIEKDLKQNGIEIYSIQEMESDIPSPESTTYIEGLTIPDNEMNLINSIKDILSSKGYWTDEMESYLGKIDYSINITN